MDENIQAHVIIQGRVQGVFFRVETRKAARGMVLQDGSETCPMGRLRQSLKEPGNRLNRSLMVPQRPPFARLDKVDVQWKSAAGQLMVLV